MPWGALAGAAALYASHLASLPPDRRAAVLARMREERELEALESSPEVRLARQYISDDALRDEHATRLLTFARDLARRRMN